MYYIYIPGMGSLRVAPVSLPARMSFPLPSTSPEECFSQTPVSVRENKSRKRRQVMNQTKKTTTGAGSIRPWLISNDYNLCSPQEKRTCLTARRKESKPKSYVISLYSTCIYVYIYIYTYYIYIYI